MDDLTKLLAAHPMDFLERSIARELHALLLGAKPAGKLSLQIESWASSWKVSEGHIWCVIDKLIEQGYWFVKNGTVCDELICESISGSAIALGRKQKRSTLQKIKEVASVDRAHALRIEAVGPSVASELTEQIDPDKRKAYLSSGGYPGWLPSAYYWSHGIAFKPDAGLLAKLEKKFPKLCIDTSLALMFDDLKSSKDRPTIPSFPFWITRWLEKSGTEKNVKREVVDNLALTVSRMDEY